MACKYEAAPKKAATGKARRNERTDAGFMMGVGQGLYFSEFAFISFPKSILRTFFL